MNALAHICIANYHFAIYNNSPFELVFETGFEDFLKSEAPSTDRQINCEEGFIDLTLLHTLYQAKHGEQLLWEIKETDQGRWFFVYHPQSGQLQQQAHYDSTSATWTIHSKAFAYEQTQALNPLAYPMAPLMWYVFTTEEPMLLIHASGLTDGYKGRIFAGFSGVGKSTMASIWQSNSAEVINDDRLLIKKEKDGSWRMYNTPMYYRARPISAALQHIYFPFHSPSNTIENLSGAKAIAQLLAYTIHHGYDAQHLQHHSNIAEQLLQSITAAKLGVVPTDAIIDFIKSHE